MIICPKCKNKYSIKARFNMLKDKNKAFVCSDCGNTCSLKLLPFNISFIFSAIVFILLNGKLFLWLNNFINNESISQILKLILGASWMFGFVFLVSYLIREENSR